MAIVVAAWFAFDRATKLHFDQFPLGEALGGPYLGLFEFTLVHNTGAAWGLFSGSTFALGVNSVVISIVVFAAALFLARRSNWVFSLGAALVVAGGLGNAFDRFAYDYVVDFINVTFIEFPVFNIADIGVTCGCALVIVAILFFWKETPKPSVADAEASPGRDPDASGEGGDR